MLCEWEKKRHVKSSAHIHNAHFLRYYPSTIYSMFDHLLSFCFLCRTAFIFISMRETSSTRPVATTLAVTALERRDNEIGGSFDMCCLSYLPAKPIGNTLHLFVPMPLKQTRIANSK